MLSIVYLFVWFIAICRGVVISWLVVWCTIKMYMLPVMSQWQRVVQNWVFYFSKTKRKSDVIVYSNVYVNFRVWVDDPTVHCLVHRGGSRGGGLKLEKIWFFGVKSWFFTRNIPTIFALPSTRRNFFRCAPLTWNPESAPGTYLQSYERCGILLFLM